MPVPDERIQGPPSSEAVLTEINAGIGRHHQLLRPLPGGEQSGAQLVIEDDRCAVLKWERAGYRADQLLRAWPAVRHATARGWPAARWLEAGPLAGGGAFLLQEYVQGSPMSRFDARQIGAVVAANAKQGGLAFDDSRDDSGQLQAVLSGACAWKARVAGFSPAGAALVKHGDEVAAWAGSVPIPLTDVVHGDYSSTNLLLDPTRSTAILVDCQGIGRGSRVRDLADLYRQSFVYPTSYATGLSLLRAAASAIEGAEVFAKCAVAVTYNNLAWWVEHKTRGEFDAACGRLHRLFDDLRHGP